MHLLIIRHADAVPLTEGGSIPDADRPLTQTGQQQSAALGESLRRLPLPPTEVITSPLLRARQTADGILQAWGTSPPALTICEDLAPGFRRKRLTRFLRQRGQPCVAVVGHEPDFSRYAAWLIGSKKAHLALAKAGVACVHFPASARQGRGELSWLLTPELFTNSATSKS